MMKTKINKFHSTIEENMRYIILPHVLPDGDTIGSSIALKKYLTRLGKTAHIISDDIMPYDIKFIANGEVTTSAEFDDSSIAYDVVIALDSSDTERLGKRIKYIESARLFINIDHHITNKNYADINIVDPEASSTGELLYEIISQKQFVTKDEAEGLYVAISTDTGSFKYSNTTSKTHRVVAELLDKGIDPAHINTELYQNKPFEKIKLHSEAMNSLQLYKEDRFAFIYVTQDMLQKSGASMEASDGLVEHVRDIEGVEVVILLKQMEERLIKVSMRSKYDFNVAKIALDFGGGGHVKAAGCVINDSLKNSIEILKEKVLQQ